MSTRGWTIGGLAALIAVPIGIALAPFMTPGHLPNAATKAADALHRLAGVDLLTMLAARSPGTRAVGDLADTKRRKQALPHQRALAKVRTPKPLPDSFVKPLFGEASPAEPVLDSVPAQLAALPTYAPAMSPAPTLSVDVPPGDSTGGPGSPGGPGGGVTPPPAVPEPSTWAMMLLGFGMIGVLLRRRAGCLFEEVKVLP